ncbi:NUC153 domain-containing protein [Haematococcus lacustris]|uniref:NUC153 domain-containing protein n=1 Tax=Haematococcus lacustris TaxID=44745 RepID=A0A6A0A1U2_HAELA|nr:NUC153 domain-containing protein [Haematococcus lacustris]
MDIRDVATSVPADYAPPQSFNTSLQHTDPSLTWDAEDEGRKRVLQKKALLLAGGKGSKDGEGSSDDGSSSDEDEVGAGEGMHGGTEDGTGAAVKAQRQPAKRKAGSKDGLEMQVVYAPALEQLATRVAERKQAAATQTSQAGETVWQAYLRRRKEKKKERKTRRKRGVNSSDDDDDDDSIALAGVQGKTAKAKITLDATVVRLQAAAAQPGSDADEDPWNDPFFNQEGEGVRSAKPGSKAARQREAAAEEAEEAGGFHANLADVRFQNLFTDHNFALDPTDPR